ncbi:Imidazoleglycerol-phosphate dehydratase [Thermoproteus uzoniensis 768-20]|uniref:Imidazoleglycerol-phosphate dehydratase n=1 Tax=Thermoproteus uzoniensis (strain 768-20) TaxID=999630 RepID=F2L2W3_THEU7|nr:imidazoleglycerol-phosphate dehydratase [Thermoproteus uzoniensis]AEA11901.1 Imidazoleglycerol-phosphate dehydratase [Thermoproteus uzoniensis 768-20]
MVVRETKETRVVVELTRGGPLSISAPVPFLAHMVETLLYYAGLGGRLEAKVLRDLDEGHHVIEDVGLALGMALSELAGDRRSIARYGWAIVPMDEAEAVVAVDLGGRPYWVVKARLPRIAIGGYPTYMFPHFVRSLASELKATIHVRALGEDPHHIIEAAHKALGLALRQALAPSDRPVTTK